MPDHYSKLRLAIPPVNADDVLHGLAVLMDEIRSMAATFDEVSKVLSKIGQRPVSTVILEIQADYLKNLETACNPTCDMCCHYQAPPPRCRFSKHRISPKQFTCKNYSPKYKSLK